MGWSCGQLLTAPGVWFRIVGVARTLTASLCGAFTDYDTRLTVYCGECPARQGVLYCVAENRRNCQFPHLCPVQSTGPCCFQNDLCIATTQSDCTGNLLGVWSGPGGRCPVSGCDGDCPGPADGDMDAN